MRIYVVDIPKTQSTSAVNTILSPAFDTGTLFQFFQQKILHSHDYKAFLISPRLFCSVYYHNLFKRIRNISKWVKFLRLLFLRSHIISHLNIISLTTLIDYKINFKLLSSRDCLNMRAGHMTPSSFYACIVNSQFNMFSSKHNFFVRFNAVLDEKSFLR